MRKFLMFGTMLGVASAALAFGGVFNHGSKSSTYKGGVDAIGVHFGEKKQKQCGLGWTLNEESNECECPEERQCGDVCCGIYNVCVGDNKCCYQDTEGNVDEESCCDTSVSLGAGTGTGEFMPDGEDWTDVRCCGLDSRLTVGSEDEHKADCCPADSPGVCDEDDCDGNGSRCCPSGTIILRDEEGWKHCCPIGTLVFNMERQECCPIGATYVNEDAECCGGPNTTLYTIHNETQCCSTGQGEVLVEDENGDIHCCPEGSTRFDADHDVCKNN